MIMEALTDASILIVDDEEANLDLLEGLLESEGYTRISRTSDARRALGEFVRNRADLVLLDLHMPHRNGFEVLAEIRAVVSPEEFVPVLVLTADVTSEARDRALTDGAHDFLIKPFDAVEVLLRVRNLLETRRLHLAQRSARTRAERAEGRARLLAEASRLAASSLDRDTALAQVCRLVEPALGSWCTAVIPDGRGYRLVDGGASGEADHAPLPAELPGILDDVLDGSDARMISLADPGTGGPAPVELLAVPMRTQGESEGALLVAPLEGAPFSAEDTEMLSDLAGRLALALHNARLFADAQSATRDRERLLSVVAHDLRNPLAVIAMYAEMLLDLLPPEDEGYTAEALASIQISARRMQDQIEDLLDHSRLQGGSFSVSRVPCSVEDLFAEAELLLRPLASTQSVELRFAGDSGSRGVTAELDPIRLQQVISNLVGNAIKFTPAGGTITVEWGAAGNELRVSVADSGPGIPMDELPHVFGAFWQAREADRRGVGLGLWISRAIVEGHDGRIWVESSRGEGATFHFALPLVEASRGVTDPMGRVTHAALAPSP
jgi:signal transduction histidine kinase/DNA-binding response OmpR family regulator